MLLSLLSKRNRILTLNSTRLTWNVNILDADVRFSHRCLVVIPTTVASSCWLRYSLCFWPDLPLHTYLHLSHPENTRTHWLFACCTSPDTTLNLLPQNCALQLKCKTSALEEDKIAFLSISIISYNWFSVLIHKRTSLFIIFLSVKGVVISQWNVYSLYFLWIKGQFSLCNTIGWDLKQLWRASNSTIF